MDVRRIEGDEARAGYALRDKLAELLGGRKFFLLVAPTAPGAAGDCFSNMRDGDEVLNLLATAAHQLMSYDFTPGEAVELGPQQKK